MSEPIQVYDGGIMPPDPVIESWKAALDMFILKTEDFEGSANQIAQAMKETSLSTAQLNKSVQRLADMVGYNP